VKAFKIIVFVLTKYYDKLIQIRLKKINCDISNANASLYEDLIYSSQIYRHGTLWKTDSFDA